MLFSESTTLQVVSRGMPKGGSINSGRDYKFADSTLIGFGDNPKVNLDRTEDTKIFLH